MYICVCVCMYDRYGDINSVLNVNYVFTLEYVFIIILYSLQYILISGHTHCKHDLFFN